MSNINSKKYYIHKYYSFLLFPTTFAVYKKLHKFVTLFAEQQQILQFGRSPMVQWLWLARPEL